jgi:hypothetical protein
VRGRKFLFMQSSIILTGLIMVGIEIKMKAIKLV